MINIELATRQRAKAEEKVKVVKFPQNKTVCLLLSFFIPAIILTICYIMRRIAPFGDSSLCSMDGFSQYYPMLENMARAFKKGELFYSFSGGLGYNLWAQTSYYTNSPLWLLLYIFPESTHLSIIDLTIMLRLSLASLTFCIRLNSRYKLTTIKLLPFTALSCAYALSSYAIAYINQFMWTDALILLPLVILGIEKLCENQRPFFYIITLALTIWSCFYIGYMVCIFAVMYMLYLLLSNSYTLKHRITTVLRFMVSSLIAGLLTAVSIIPIFLAITQTKASSLGAGTIGFYDTFTQLLKNFLPFSKISLEYGAANVYCGIVTIVIAVALLFFKQIPKRKRITAFFFVIFMLLSFELNILTFIWHGFHYPNQLPQRNSFLLIFLLLSIASEFFSTIDYTPVKIYSKKINFLCSNSTMAIALATLLLLEIGSSAIYQLTTQTWVSAKTSLQRDSQIAEKAVALNPKENEFYRTEFTSSRKNNPGLQYGYNGISYYSSTMTSSAYNFFERLGMPRYAKYVSTQYTHSEILDALFSVRYIINEDGKTITENRNYLPLVFKADDNILELDIYENEGIILQQKLWDAICGKTGISIEDGVKQLSGCSMKIISFSSSNIEGKISCDSPGILFTSLPDDGGWSVYIDGKETDTTLICGYLCSAKISKGDHNITLKYTPPGFTLGLTVTLISLAAAIVFYFIYRRKAHVSL